MVESAYKTLKNAHNEYELMKSLLRKHTETDNEEMKFEIEKEVERILAKYDPKNDLPKVGQKFKCKRDGYINTNYLSKGDIVTLVSIQIGKSIDMIILVDNIRHISLSQKDFKRRFTQ